METDSIAQGINMMAMKPTITSAQNVLRRLGVLFVKQMLYVGNIVWRYNIIS